MTLPTSSPASLPSLPDDCVALPPRSRLRSSSEFSDSLTVSSPPSHTYPLLSHLTAVEQDEAAGASGGGTDDGQLTLPVAVTNATRDRCDEPESPQSSTFDHRNRSFSIGSVSEEWISTPPNPSAFGCERLGDAAGIWRDDEEEGSGNGGSVKRDGRLDEGGMGGPSLMIREPKGKEPMRAFPSADTRTTREDPVGLPPLAVRTAHHSDLVLSLSFREETSSSPLQSSGPESSSHTPLISRESSSKPELIPLSPADSSYDSGGGPSSSISRSSSAYDGLTPASLGGLPSPLPTPLSSSFSLAAADSASSSASCERPSQAPSRPHSLFSLRSSSTSTDASGTSASRIESLRRRLRGSRIGEGKIISSIFSRKGKGVERSVGDELAPGASSSSSSSRPKSLRRLSLFGSRAPGLAIPADSTLTGNDRSSTSTAAAGGTEARRSSPPFQTARPRLGTSASAPVLKAHLDLTPGPAAPTDKRPLRLPLRDLTASATSSLTFTLARVTPLPGSTGGTPNSSLLSVTRPVTPLVSPVAGEAVEQGRDLFAEMLPREIQVLIFRTLLDIWRSEEAEGIRRSERWVGEAGGGRELCKLSRVSKTWQSLVFDGQLWPGIATRPLVLPDPNVGGTSENSTLLTIASHSGQFLRRLELRNFHQGLSSATLHALALACARPLNRHVSDVSRKEERTIDDEAVIHVSDPRIFAGLDDLNAPVTGLTSLDLVGCRTFSSNALHHLLAKSPFLRRVVLRGVPAVCNTTAYILSISCPELVSVDLSLCRCLNSASIADLADGGHSTLYKPSGIKELRVAGLRNVDKAFMLRLATGFPSLQILDLSRCQSLTDDHLLAFVTHDPALHCSRLHTTLTDKQAGFDASSPHLKGVGHHLRRITSLRHLNLSACPRLTDRGLWHIAHAVPKLEFLELAGMNTRLHNDGLLALLPTVPRLAKLDLEEATEITNDVLEALTPSAREESDTQEVVKDEEETGSRLDHLIISFAGRLTSEAIQRLIEGCPRLRILEADNTKIANAAVKVFLRQVTARKLHGAEISVTDSRVVTRTYIQEQHSQPTIRPRRGHRGWAFLPFHYTDASLANDNYSGPGRDECNNARVVLKSFWGWSLVDAIRGEEEAEKKRRRTMSLLKNGGNGSSGSERTTAVGGGGRRLIGWRSGGGGEGGGGGTVTVPGGSWRNLNASTMGEANVPVGVAGGAHGAGRRTGGAQVQCVVM